MHAFRRGAFQLAMEFALPVVPVTIDGAYKVMPRGAVLPRYGVIRLTIHKPIFAPEGGRHELSSLMKESYDAVASALQH